jgi:L-2-hydroxyglutarate oxidase LhgO
MPDYDVVIVGAGVVGLACARSAARSGRSVLLVERHTSCGQETSSRNSQVVHAGFYYEPKSNKARLCARGNQSLRAYCEARGVPLAAVGKYIVATEEAELSSLVSLRARGVDNGVALEEVSGAAIRRAEPAVAAVAGLWSPTTAIVDSHALMSSLLAEAREHGADIAFRHTLVGAGVVRGGYELALRQPDGSSSIVTTAHVVNSGGLAADTVCELIGLPVEPIGYRQKLVKGSYFRLGARWSGRVRRLIYPVPPRDLAGLGVHLTLELDGSLRLGPDVEPVGRDFSYAVDESRRAVFHGSALRFLPTLVESDLIPDQSGVRPKRMLAGGMADFAIEEERGRGLPGWINLIGIESPGLTCCLEIANEVVAFFA